MNCTPSAVANAEEEDRPSIFAEEGSLAHALGAYNIKKGLSLSTFTEEIEIEKYNPELHDGEMDECTDAYADYVLDRYHEATKTNKEASILIEQTVNFSHLVPGGFGTADAMIIDGEQLEIIDFKYGKGVEVSAKMNPQMMLYAIGAIRSFNLSGKTKVVKMTIFQPRKANLSEFVMTADALEEWGENVAQPLAKLAARGRGHRNAGEWCRFCKCAGQCGTLARFSISTTEWADGNLTPDELGTLVLPVLPIISSWIDKTKETSLQFALEGEKVTGYKVVAGRSVRKITDTEAVATRLLENGFRTEDIYKPTELRTITELEKGVGKKTFNSLCGEYIHKPEGKPTLVPEDDKREALDPKNDFNGIL